MKSGIKSQCRGLICSITITYIVFAKDAVILAESLEAGSSGSMKRYSQFVCVAKRKSSWKAVRTSDA